MTNSNTPTFSNKPNPCVSVEGKPLWVSRSCAVVAEILIFNKEDQEWYVLLNKRGDNTPDFKGYWCLPCGYLDWDETAPQAVVREVFEECGLFLPSMSNHQDFLQSSCSLITGTTWDSEVPWKVHSEPVDRQNVSLHYAALSTWKSNNFPPLSAEYCEEGEVADLAWVNLADAVHLDLAFGHQHVLSELSRRL